MTTSSLTKKDYLPLKQEETTPHLEQNECLQEDSSARSSLIVNEKRHQCSVWKATLNLLNFMEGVGFLALPYAVHRGGITAVILFFVLLFVMGYTAKILVECLYETNEAGKNIRVRSSYQEIGLHCWAPLKHLLAIAISITMFIALVSYVVLFASMMHQVFPGVPLTESQLACVATAIVLPLVFLEYLSRIAWLSLFALLALIGSVCLCLTYELQEANTWDVQSLMFWDTRGVIIALSIILFSYGVHIVAIPVEGEMADKSKYNVALALTFCAGAFIKIVFAVAGFLTYTSVTNEVIVNNLPTGIPTKIIATLFSASVLITYPIPFLVFVRILEESPIFQNVADKIHPKCWFITIRVGLVFFILGAAILLPHFALITSLGGCFVSLIATFFPALFHLCLKYKRLSKLQVLVDCFLMVFSIFVTGFGLVETVIALIR